MLYLVLCKTPLCFCYFQVFFKLVIKQCTSMGSPSSARALVLFESEVSVVIQKCRLLLICFRCNCILGTESPTWLYGAMADSESI